MTRSATEQSEGARRPTRQAACSWPALPAVLRKVATSCPTHEGFAARRNPVLAEPLRESPHLPPGRERCFRLKMCTQRGFPGVRHRRVRIRLTRKRGQLSGKATRKYVSRALKMSPLVQSQHFRDSLLRKDPGETQGAHRGIRETLHDVIHKTRHQRATTGLSRPVTASGCPYGEGSGEPARQLREAGG